MATTTSQAGFTPRAALGSVAWFAAAGVAISLTKALTGFGLPCPWRALTGTLCPLCGSTTMGVHLLGGDLAAAWQSNPFVLVLLGGLAVAVVAWSVELLGGPALRPPRRLRSARGWWVVLIGVALGFTLWRNLA